MPEATEKLGAMGRDVVGCSPEQFTQTIRDDAVKLGAVTKAAGIKLDRSYGVPVGDAKAQLDIDLCKSPKEFFDLRC
ncbi:hypothetical protein QTI24_19055 [Variovorax sp. J22P240]|uniref:hypothetical protein n=1 Tax=Variovorax sp. J22P240 TaxID=3053514 RepID=UPI002575CDA7|nr:hypothetical protein [Variovorax sp. J22P240]MDM0000722.1 hypothetical protein [Variovorax sp. J22P240]